MHYNDSEVGVTIARVFTLMEDGFERTFTIEFVVVEAALPSRAISRLDTDAKAVADAATDARVLMAMWPHEGVEAVRSISCGVAPRMMSDAPPPNGCKILDANGAVVLRSWSN